MGSERSNVDVLIRVAGMAAWLGVAVPLTDGQIRELVSPGWVVAYAAYGVVFWRLSGTDATLRHGQWWALGLAACGMAVHLLAPAYGYSAVLPVLSTAVAAFLLPFRAVALLIVAQTAVLMFRGDRVVATQEGVTQALTLAGFQFFALGMVRIMERESQAREALAQAHAELTAAHAELETAHRELEAAQAQLAESSRAAERLRISRDLHDLVGHQLTALAVNLEVASHVTQGQAKEQVDLSRAVAKDLLRDVRGVVGALREGPTDLSAALRRLSTSVPSPSIHLDVPDDLHLQGLQRAEALLRCVQEIITNAVRHANAQNLWIAVSETAAGEAVIAAHDDGQGADIVTAGNGLVGMRERLEQLGGRMSYRSSPGRGFAVEARLPVAA